MKLQKLQQEFFRHLYFPEKNKIFAELKNKGAEPAKRLQIYRNNFFGSLQNSLFLTYPKIAEIVGEAEFKRLAAEYCQKFYSKSGNLDDYGKYFSAFLKKHQLAFLPDLAQLEWSYHLAYFHQDIKKLDVKKLQNLSEEDFFNIKFTLHPSCYLLASEHNLYQLYQYPEKNFAKKTAEKSPFQKRKNIAINVQNNFLLIERCHFKTNIHQLSEQEYNFLKLVKAKNNLYQIYEILSANKNSKKNLDIGALSAKFIENGVLCRFHLVKS